MALFPPAVSHAHRLVRSLWLAGLGLALFLGTLLIGNQFIQPTRSVGRGALGHDFLAFYTAGHFLRTHQPEKVYDLQATRTFQKEVAAQEGLELGNSYGPFWNPPVFALLFVPFSAWSFSTALTIWWLLSATCLGASIWILMGLLPAEANWKTKALIPLLLCLSLPCIQAIAHGQNTFISLLLMSATVSLWLKAAANDSFSGSLLAGIIGGLLFYKPQLALVLAAGMVWTLGWPALLGMMTTGMALLLATLAFTPQLLSIYLHRLPVNLAIFQEQQSYLWERHITFKAFWRLLLQNHNVGPTTTTVKVLRGLSTLGLASVLISAALRVARWGKSHLRSTRSLRNVIAAAILGMPLLMPFYFDYDLTLLAVAGVLIGAELYQQERLRGVDRWCVGAFAALYLAMYFNPVLAGRIRFDFAVPLLAALTVLQVRRTNQRQEIHLPVLFDHDLALAVAA